MPAAPKRILVVDDETKFCQLVSSFLKARGYEVMALSDSGEALTQLEQFRPDIVLVDMIMPGLSGLDLLKLVRQRAQAPRVIMVTANDDEQVAQQAMQHGADAFLVKPVNFDALAQVIAKIYGLPAAT